MEMVEVVVEQDPPAHGDVDEQILGELVGLATLPGVEGPVRPVLALYEGRVDLAAGRGRIQGASETVLEGVAKKAKLPQAAAGAGGSARSAPRPANSPPIPRSPYLASGCAQANRTCAPRSTATSAP